jgi:dTDP-glucose 4,6-dehydratase
VRVLVPGGAGFLGSNFVQRLVAAGDEVVVLDRLTDFGSLARLEGVPHEFVQGDVADAVTATGAADGCHAIVNFAAETNLDASGLASGGFIVTDVYGTHVLLEFARVAGIRYVQVSTSEADRPGTTSAASRAGADLQVQAYVEANGLNASVTRAVRAYGPFQYPATEPAAAIVGALDSEGSSLETLSGAWVHADDHSAAVELVLRQGAQGEIYRVGEDDDALRALGWEPAWTIEQGLAETVEWYRSSRDWWEPIKSRTQTPSPEEQYARRSGG